MYINYLLVNKFVDDQVTAKILRDGEPMEVQFKLSSSTDLTLVPAKSCKRPSYLVYGGLVFTNLSISYLREFETSEDSDNWFDAAPRDLVHRALHQLKEKPDEELVILGHVLADDLNYGYAHLYNLVLTEYNGVKIHNLRHLHKLITDSKEKFSRFDFADKSIVILDAGLVKKKNKTILKDYSIITDASEDLLAGNK